MDNFTFKKYGLIALVGPTASGKSDLAVALAKKLGGEVISADSRQVYRELSIGSGKITKNDMKGVLHHMLDVASVKRTYSVSKYQKQARHVLEGLLARGVTPIICGGTGQYVDALLFDVRFPDVGPDMKLREKLERMDTDELFALLKQKDTLRAASIDSHNRRRLIRALEVACHLGASPRPASSKLLYPTFFVGIHLPKAQLHARIHERLARRLRGGMIGEVAGLHAHGVSWKRLEALGLEYRYVAFYLQGKLNKEELFDQLYAQIKKYASRQMTWFKRNKRIHWISGPDISLL